MTIWVGVYDVFLILGPLLSSDLSNVVDLCVRQETRTGYSTHWSNGKDFLIIKEICSSQYWDLSFLVNICLICLDLDF